MHTLEFKLLLYHYSFKDYLNLLKTTLDFDLMYLLVTNTFNGENDSIFKETLKNTREKFEKYFNIILTGKLDFKNKSNELVESNKVEIQKKLLKTITEKNIKFSEVMNFLKNSIDLRN